MLFLTVALTDLVNYDPSVDEISHTLGAIFAILVFLVTWKRFVGLDAGLLLECGTHAPCAPVYACTNISVELYRFSRRRLPNSRRTRASS